MGYKRENGVIVCRCDACKEVIAEGTLRVPVDDDVRLCPVCAVQIFMRMMDGEKIVSRETVLAEIEVTRACGIAFGSAVDPNDI
jgi:hypothetical protein